MINVIILGSVGHGVSATMDALVAQFPKADIIIVDNIQQQIQLQNQIEQNVKTYKIEPVAMHETFIRIETKLPKPYIKMKKNHFDKHRFKRR